jgi:hypothetical protein
MNLEDSELERHWATLRDLAEPAPAERQQVLEAVRAAIALEASRISGGGLEAQPAPPHPSHSVPKLRGGTTQMAPSDQLAPLKPRPLRPWIGGALIGAALGLGIGLGLQRAGTPSTTTPPPSLPTTASGAVLSGAPPPHVESEPEPAANAEAGTPETSSTAALPESTTPALAPRGRVRGRSNRHSFRPAAQRKPSPPRPSDDDFEQQLALLQRAESALHASDPELALGFLSDLDRRAPPTSLRQERLTALVLARCALGQVDAARSARRELFDESPSSIYLQRLAESCAGDAEPGPPSDPK